MSGSGFRAPARAGPGDGVRSRRLPLRAFVVLAVALASAAANAAPFVPADDAVVLETLPERADRTLAALKRLRADALRAPSDPAAAAAFARPAIDATRLTGDPRYQGQALAVLSPWWGQRDAPPAVLILRATIKQSLHDFDAALADLDRLLAVAPRNAQGYLTRATVRTVRGRYTEASEDCDALYGIAPPLLMTACRADIASRTGRAKEAQKLITDALAGDRGDAGARAWAMTITAEIAARRGDAPSAERYFLASLALGPADPYTLGAYADWLLDAGRPHDVVALLAARTRLDPLLLRLTLALRALPERDAYEQRRADLVARMAATRQRGDVVHRREEARYVLEIEGDAAAAARIARLNWEKQREPADLRILAESARAAGDESAMRIVADWIAATGLEDVRIHALLNGGA
jgi:predicted Zn-dependent protease